MCLEFLDQTLHSVNYVRGKDSVSELCQSRFEYRDPFGQLLGRKILSSSSLILFGVLEKFSIECRK